MRALTFALLLAAAPFAASAAEPASLPVTFTGL